MDVQVTQMGEVIFLKPFCNPLVLAGAYSPFFVGSADRGGKSPRETRFRYGFCFVYLDEYDDVNGVVCTID